MNNYKIFVKTINDKFLTFTVDSYKVKDNRILFLDKKTNKNKNFDSRNCEIQEVSQ